MARARNIKPAIMGNEELAELEPLTRLLFIYLWMLADREGRLEDRPKRIGAQALPYDRGADVDAMLDQLHQVGFIARYEANGVACIQISAFTKHQAPHVREAASELPSPEQGTAKVVTKHSQGNDEASPGSPDSPFLIPDSGFSDCGLQATQALPGRTRKQSGQSTLTAKDLIAEGVDPQHATDWLILRKAKRLPLTASAWATTKSEGQNAGFNARDTVAYAVSANWAAFKFEWFQRASAPNSGNNAQRETFKERDERLARERWEQATGRRSADHRTIDITPPTGALEFHE
jgi:hypothetical protein